MLAVLLLCFNHYISISSNTSFQFKTGASLIETYLPTLEGKNVAVVANQTSMIGQTHLVDTLLQRGVSVIKVFAPEHGFRGDADAGAFIEDERDSKTNLPVISLYGKHKKPSITDLDNIDIVLFDIQDVGARFYTYISTLHYVMEACAENNTTLLVLDRPNPNGSYVDGPLLDTAFKSFVGMHPVPIVHGMTIAEYARMINGEFWLKDSIQCELMWQKMPAYTRKMPYDLPIKPSPNLPNPQSISWYPSLCLFEGTDISVGRGTTLQFQIIGSPKLDSCSYSFIPVSREGANSPKHENTKCCGWDLSSIDLDDGIHLDLLIKCYHQYSAKNRPFFNSFFDKLAGSNKLRKQISEGWTSSQIKESWQEGLEAFIELRKTYLLYP